LFAIFNNTLRKELKFRLGLISHKKSNYIWIHGASLGEINSLHGIVNKLNSNEVDILITSFSKNGLKSKIYDNIKLICFDNILFYFLYFRKVKIEKFILSENELWLNMLLFIKLKKINAVIINAKINNSKVYSNFNFLIKFLLKDFSKISCENIKTFNFYKKCLDSKGIYLNTNTKYLIKETKIKNFTKEELKINKNLVITFSSIRPKELDYICSEIFLNKDTFYILAPRHIEKVAIFMNYFKSLNIKVSLFSKDKSFQNSKVLIIDTLGDLNKFFDLSDIVFVGGTLAPGYGGHNPLDAAAFNNQIISGNHFDSQTEIINKMIKKDAIKIIDKKFTFNDMLLENELLKRNSKLFINNIQNEIKESINKVLC